MNKENSESNNCKYKEYNNFKKARYFHGMLMTERDFQDEQKYHIEKRKLVNRMLHGYGVVCGLQIKPTTPTASSTITISPGLALDCNGNEIYVNKEISLNLEKIRKPEPVMTAKKTFCNKDTESGDEERMYIIIRYDERDTDQVPIYAPGGDCKEKVCENSRKQEGFCIDYTYVRPCDAPKPPNDPCIGEKKDEDIRKLIFEDLLNPCHEPCCDSKVVLGSISISESDPSGTKIENFMINNWDCRKYVMSFGLLQHFKTIFPGKEINLDAILDTVKENVVATKDPKSAIESAKTVLKEICPLT
jgi:hypothetical protein